MENITRGIAIEFCQPPLASVRRRGAVPTALVSMPEATMHENDGLAFFQNDVRAPRQILSMQPESIPHPMQQFANDYFRTRVFSPNPAHVP
jgi:hypothetical protein